MPQLQLIPLLTATVIAGILGVSSYFLGTTIITPTTAVELTPERGSVVVGETFTLSILVRTEIPTNVFKGTVRFDHRTLAVSAIDYNISIADLWAEAPWYSNGDGTISFIGGTTKSGGFTGRDTLMTITFTAIAAGDAAVSLEDMQILAHDGLGTEVTLDRPIDAIFMINQAQLLDETILATRVVTPIIQVLSAPPQRDLNQDGTVSFADVSVFMTDLVSGNLRSDLNQDGNVNLQDLSILTE